jgi:hypothetical protein
VRKKKSAMHSKFLASRMDLMESESANPGRAARSTDFEIEEQRQEVEFGEDKMRVRMRSTLL